MSFREYILKNKLKKKNKFFFFKKFDDLLTEEEKLDCIKQDYTFIKKLKNPSEALQIAAIKTSIEALKYLKKPSEKVLKEAINEDYKVLEFIKNPSTALQLEALPYGYKKVLSLLENPSKETQLEAISFDPFALEFIKNPLEEVQIKAINEYSNNIYSSYYDFNKLISFIENPSEKVQRTILKERRDFEKIKNKTVRNVEIYIELYGDDLKEDETFDFRYLEKYKKKSVIIRKQYYKMLIEEKLFNCLTKKERKDPLYKKTLTEITL